MLFLCIKKCADACEILGLDPLTIANEGKLLLSYQPRKQMLPWRLCEITRLDVRLLSLALCRPNGGLVLRTDIGGMRVLDMLVGDPLPRIC